MLKETAENIKKQYNQIEERIPATMNLKRTPLVTFLSAGLIVFSVSLFTASAADQKRSASIIHESADILRYEDGSPYIHGILTNNTDKAITETQYCMLAFDENGSPLKLHWNFLDSSAESSFENLVLSEKNLLPGQTENYRGGWSLYDGEVMADLGDNGNSGTDQSAYALLCLKQVVFEDGTLWNNPNYETWLNTYAGKEIRTDELQNYYPHEYKIESDREL